MNVALYNFQHTQFQILFSKKFASSVKWTHSKNAFVLVLVDLCSAVAFTFSKLITSLMHKQDNWSYEFK